MKRKLFASLLLCAIPAAYAQETKQTTITTSKPQVTQEKVVEKTTVERTAVEPSHIAGNVASVDSGDSTLLLSVPGNSTPLRFYFGEDTTFFDASGDPLTQEALKLGQPVKLDYIKTGDKLIITKAHLEPMGATEKIEVHAE